MITQHSAAAEAAAEAQSLIGKLLWLFLTEELSDAEVFYITQAINDMMSMVKSAT